MWRYIFLLFFILVVCTSSITINVIQLILYFTVKQISSDIYYKINYYLFYTHCSMPVFFVDWYTNSELYVYMDSNDFKKYFGKEHMYVIANHIGEIDWLFYTLISERANLLGNLKVYCKNDAMYVPGSGLNLLLSDCIFLRRNYQKDKKTIEDKIKILMNYPSHIYIFLTPEGTRFEKEKHELSMQFAKEKGLPILKHLLCPKTKAFTTSLPLMQEKLKAVYDVTIAFNPRETQPKFLNILLGKKIKAYCYIKRIPMEDIQKDEEGASKFIHDLFVEKDELLDIFYKTGDFLTESTEKKVVKMKTRKSVLILLNAIAWYIIFVLMVLLVLIYLLVNGYTSTLLICVGLYILFLTLAYKIGSYALIKNKPK